MCQIQSGFQSSDGLLYFQQTPSLLHTSPQVLGCQVFSTGARTCLDTNKIRTLSPFYLNIWSSNQRVQLSKLLLVNLLLIPHSPLLIFGSPPGAIISISL